MNIHKKFESMFTYAAGVEQWCKLYLKEQNGTILQHTFPYDFAIADWKSENAVKETYRRVKKEWLSNYKAFTEVAMTLNMLSWANDQLKSQGIDDREKYINLYSELWYEAKDTFYDKYGKNEEACDYFFQMTD